MKRYTAWLWVLLLSLLPFVSDCTTENERQNALCLVYFLDVGQGDCALIRTDEGDILIDCGPESAQAALCLHLEQLGVRELALAVFTHPDEDHIGGADGVLMQFPTKEVWLPDVAADNESAMRMEEAIEQSGARRRTVTAGELLQIGKLCLTVLSPLEESETGTNESSIVLNVACGEVGMMFMGDAGVKVEQALLTTYGASHVRATLYKVGHHGSSTSNSEAWLAAVDPDYAVICSSADNSYGHPHGAIIRALEATGATVLQTATMGEIVFACDGNALYLLHDTTTKERGNHK